MVLGCFDAATEYESLYLIHFYLRLHFIIPYQLVAVEQSQFFTLLLRILMQ